MCASAAFEGEDMRLVRWVVDPLGLHQCFAVKRSDDEHQPPRPKHQHQDTAVAGKPFVWRGGVCIDMKKYIQSYWKHNHRDFIYVFCPQNAGFVCAHNACLHCPLVSNMVVFLLGFLNSKVRCLWQGWDSDTLAFDALAILLKCSR